MADLHKYGCTVDLEWPNVAHVGKKGISPGVSHAPILKGGLQYPKVYGPSYMHAHGMRNNNQVLQGDQTRWEDNYDRIDHVLQPWPKFLTQMLTCYLFAVANLLVFISTCIQALHNAINTSSMWSLQCVYSVVMCVYRQSVHHPREAYSVCTLLSCVCTDKAWNLWVQDVSCHAVTWPLRNISAPVWAIIAPLSIQNRSSVANRWAPLSSAIFAIISCSRTLPSQHATIYWCSQEKWFTWRITTCIPLSTSSFCLISLFSRIILGYTGSSIGL